MQIIIILIILAICINIYISNTYIKLTKVEIKSKKIPKEFDGYKLLQLSDLHSEFKGKDNKKILKIVDEVKPDIIITTGDMVDKKDKEFKSYISLLKHLNKKYKIYSVNGNNEISLPYNLYKVYKEKAKKEKSIIIDNKKIEIQKGKSIINIYGIKYKHSLTEKNKECRNKRIIQNALGDVSKNEYNIILAHNPANLEPLSKENIDLVISGHVHGGIIKIFNRGLLSPDKKFFPKYTSGVYESKNKKTKLVLNAGLSISPLYFRINNRIEITKITLRNEV